MSAPSFCPSRLSGLIRLVAPAALILLASGALYAQQLMSIVLDGGAVVPAVSTAATGAGEITILPDRTVTGRIKVSGMVPTMAHIHEGAVDKNGPPIVTLVQSDKDNFAIPPGARLSESEYASFIAGSLYVIVVSADYPEGEIRGQLLRTRVAIWMTPPAY